MAANALFADSLTLDQGRLTVARDYWPLLQHNGLDTFDKILALGSGTVMRSVPGRRTVRIELKSETGSASTAYLKRYTPEYLTARRLFLRVMRWPGSEDEAQREWQMMHVLKAHGIGAATPIAAGQRRGWGVATHSFMMSANISGGRPGDEHVRSLDAQGRRRFTQPLAEFARRFHGQGFIHKDFYLSHIFVVEEREQPRLFLIDLQRALGPGRFRQRWLVKEIGSLAYSARKAGATRADLLRFYKLYFEKERLDQGDKRFIKKLMARVKWLFGRVPKYGESPPN